MTGQIERIVNFRFKMDAKSPDGVLNAMQHALSSTDPKCRYLVHGGPLPFDPFVVRQSFILYKVHLPAMKTYHHEKTSFMPM